MSKSNVNDSRIVLPLSVAREVGLTDERTAQTPRKTDEHTTDTEDITPSLHAVFGLGQPATLRD